MKAPTISDVAARAGVSKSTVSAVINNKDTVKTSTRRRVLSVVDELNYRPSPSARRRFRSASPRSLGFVIKEAQNTYYAEVLAGIRSVAWEKGYVLWVSSSEGDYEMEKKIVEQWAEQEIAGLIIAPIMSEDTDLSHIFELRRHNIPLVLLEGLKGIRASLTDVDNVVASYTAVGYLIEHGHSRIIHLAGPDYSAHSKERVEGVRRAFSESRLIFEERMIVPAGDSLEAGYRAGLQYFREVGGDRPTAVTCYNDLVAIGLMRALRELGLGVPEDVSVIGFDDLSLLEYLPVPLTTVRMPKFDMGRKAAQMLIEQIEAPHQQVSEKVFLEAELIIRASTRPLQRQGKKERGRRG